MDGILAGMGGMGGITPLSESGLGLVESGVGWIGWNLGCDGSNG